jgi:hypothetical protein
VRTTGVFTPDLRVEVKTRRRLQRARSLMARLRAPRLDRQLATGSEPWQSPVHAARALQLTSNRSRRTLARTLEKLVERAEEPPALYLSAVVPPCRQQVREARPLMLTLAARLRSDAPLDPRGVAELKSLISDGAGPVYVPGRPDALKTRLESIASALVAQD